MDIESLAELADADLLVRVERLVHGERRATAAVIAHLAEIEQRRLYLAEGHGSLFSYCTRVLHLSEHAAYNRIEAARVARRFPAILNCLERGDVHLTAVRLLSPLFTADNHRDLLAAAKHKSRREVEELIARLRPQPDAPSMVRKLPSATARSAAPGLMTEVEKVAEAATVPAADSEERSSAPPREASPARPAVVVPSAPERYKVQFTASAAMREKLRRAQELLRHRIPSGDIAEVVDLALDLLVEDLEKKKFAATDRPRRSSSEMAAVHRPGSEIPAARAGGLDAAALRSGEPTQPLSRHIPAEVKRAVWQRDQGRCTFVGANGVRCAGQGQLEFDHIRPHADGGTVHLDNVRLLCRPHNQHEARLFFGLWQAEGAQAAVPR